MDEAEARADERDKIAYYIIAELVCCDIFDRLEKAAEQGRWDEHKHQWEMSQEWYDIRRGPDYHAICHYGGWAASLAKHGPDVDQRHEGWQWPPWEPR